MPVHATLEHAFRTRADGARAAGAARVGVFGEGVPLPLIAAMGGLALDIKAPPLSDAADGPHSAVVAAVTEPFLDAFAARFLHRFAAGAFDSYATLIFARDDVAGLASYQYALELRRSGRLPATGPRLYLWNMLHSDSPPALAFNRTELARLSDHLAETLGSVPDPDKLSAAVAGETRRAKAVASLPSGGAEAFVARNAGRWMTSEDHTAALGPVAQTDGPHIALVGSACDVPVMHDLCSGFGQVCADLQDYGRPRPIAENAADLLQSLAKDPLAVRAAPPDRFTRALQSGTETAELVVASMDSNDDSFGWELPILKRATEARGARFLNLGFRPFRPDAAWQDRARGRIAEALA
ncbi:hypothetical protein [Anianabacter salinae]|uniref:hypothetical protein n=1 Tax=Anianabacter salinae TaxID=2851023 RepID=UPI00225E6A20|nr:hypothetical protein [Anianabacter salinae]MBV0911945.1 hypothetical protein [Anianabacter salinae]